MTSRDDISRPLDSSSFNTFGETRGKSEDSISDPENNSIVPVMSSTLNLGFVKNAEETEQDSLVHEGEVLASSGLATSPNPLSGEPHTTLEEQSSQIFLGETLTKTNSVKKQPKPNTSDNVSVSATANSKRLESVFPSVVSEFVKDQGTSDASSNLESTPKTPSAEVAAPVEPSSADASDGAEMSTLGMEHLRQVFDAVDKEGTGKVQVSRLLQLAGLHLGEAGQALSTAVSSLAAPDDTIGFPEFCRVVSAFLHPTESSSEDSTQQQQQTEIEPRFAESSDPDAGPAQLVSDSPYEDFTQQSVASLPHQPILQEEVFTSHSSSHRVVDRPPRANRSRKLGLSARDQRRRAFHRTRSLPSPPSHYLTNLDYPLPPHLGEHNPQQNYPHHNYASPSSYNQQDLSGTSGSATYPSGHHYYYSSSPPSEVTLHEEEVVARMRGEESGSPSSLSEVDSAIGGSTTSPGSCRKANSGSWMVGDRDANYESFGEVEDMVHTGSPPDRSREESEVEENGHPQPNSLPHLNLHRNTWMRRSLRSSPSSLKEGTVAPRRWGSFRHSNSRRLSGTAAGAAQQLFRSPSFSSGRSSAVALDGDDLHSDASMEDDVHDLMNQVKILQNKVEVLGDNHSDSQDRIVRVKQDNSVLQTRVMMLEEQLRDSEHRAGERLAEEQRRNKELIQRIEREKMLTVENYTIRQTNLEETNKRLEEEVHRLRTKVDRHQKERNELEDRALEAEQAAVASREESKKAAGQSRRDMQDDQERSAKVVAELRAEVERLTAVLETSARTRLPSTDSNTASTEHLTLALQSVKEENMGLHEQVEELQAQLLTRGLEEGRELVTNITTNSLAAEFEAMSAEELQKKLRETQEVNKHLRDYIDGILLTIVENHPQLLEVKQKSP